MPWVQWHMTASSYHFVSMTYNRFISSSIHQLISCVLVLYVCTHGCVYAFMYICFNFFPPPLFSTLPSPLSPSLPYPHFLLLHFYNVRAYVLTGGQHDKFYGQPSRQLYTATRTQYLLVCFIVSLLIHISLLFFFHSWILSFFLSFPSFIISFVDLFEPFFDPP